MIKIFVNDEEIVFNKNLAIKEELLTTSSTILDNCYPKSWEDDYDYISKFYFPKDYSRCDIYDDEELIFSGVVKNTGEISLNPRYPKFCKLQVLDFKTFLSEGKSLDFVIANKTIQEGIELVTREIEDYGFIVGNIMIDEANEQIGAYSTLDNSPYDVYQYFAEITNSKWFTRRIDKDTIAIDFYDIEKLPIANTIEYTNEYFEGNNIDDISFSYSTTDYRNKQIILSKQVYANINSYEEFVTDGFNKEFVTENIIGKINKICLDGVEKIFVTSDDKEIGLEADFYYKPSENKFTSASTIKSNSTITIEYIALVEGREIATNEEEISRINSQLNINGTISRYENRNDILYSNQLQSVAKNCIKYKGSAEITLKILTHENSLLSVGQRVHFNAPIEELNTDYLVKTREISIISNGHEKHSFYAYELSSNFNSESAINFFDNQRRKATGNISQGDYISRNIDVNSSANIIFDNLSIEELNIENKNSLESNLEFVL